MFQKFKIIHTILFNMNSYCFLAPRDHRQLNHKANHEANLSYIFNKVSHFPKFFHLIHKWEYQ